MSYLISLNPMVLKNIAHVWSLKHFVFVYLQDMQGVRKTGDDQGSLKQLEAKTGELGEVCDNLIARNENLFAFNWVKCTVTKRVPIIGTGSL